MSSQTPKVFLTAEWRWLAMLNYEIASEILAPLVPAGTELDSWNNKTFASLVGFLFLETRVKGIPVPFHQNFEEVNLRFYVRRKADDGWRRGVVFIKELVPRSAIAFVARNFYNENYVALSMSHQLEMAGEDPKSVRYSWRFNGRDSFMQIETPDAAQALTEGSLTEFIAEHYWGYARQRDRSTMEYRVEHPRWKFREATAVKLDCDLAGLYGEKFASFLNQPPASAFLADGSAVTVGSGMKI
jgi:uncharacterized protein YqjF (DUF2071 family)